MIKPHGLRGDVIVKLVTNRVERLAPGSRLESDVGTLEVGKRADFALYQIERPAELCYNLGANPCVSVVHGGAVRAVA